VYTAFISKAKQSEVRFLPPMLRHAVVHSLLKTRDGIRSWCSFLEALSRLSTPTSLAAGGSTHNVCVAVVVVGVAAAAARAAVAICPAGFAALCGTAPDRHKGCAQKLRRVDLSTMSR
jgi:hypothetical protein